MNPKWILLPVLLQILLTLLLFIRLGVVKAKATAAGRVDRKNAALHQEAWPEDVLKVANNIRNQFETPVLFYTLSLCLYLLSYVNWITLVLAHLYVISRYLHAWIHITSNHVPWRLKSFSFGALILLILLLFTFNGLALSIHHLP